MSIAARVANTYRDGPDLVIELIPSAPGCSAGAESLRVVNSRWDRPPPGTLLCGSDTTIFTAGILVYARYGDGDFHEHDDNPPPWHCRGPRGHPNCQCG